MKKALTITALFALPAVAMAQTFGNEGSAYVNSITSFLTGPVFSLVVAASIVVFIIGVFWFFILGAGDEEKKKRGKQLMIWGIIGLVLIFAINGIITLLMDTLGVSGSTPLTPPAVPQ